MTPTQEKSFVNAIAVPLEDWKFGYTRYGLYQNDARKISSWPVLISADTRFPYMPKAPPEPKTRLAGQWIYAGFFDHRFGHFLTETLLNVMAAKRDLLRNPDAGILMHCWPEMLQNGPPLEAGKHKEIDYFLERIGLDRTRIRFIDTELSVDQLLLGDAPFEKKFTYSKSAKSLIADTFENRPQANERLYLSRTKWRFKPRVSNELEVEKAFSDKGFRIVHLQNHSLEEQINIITGARIIAGPQGTALHWSLIAPNLQYVLSLGGKSKLQQSICQFHDQDYREIMGTRVRWNYGRFRHIRVADCRGALEKMT